MRDYKLNLRLDPETHEKLLELKGVSGESMNQIMNKLILDKNLPILLTAKPEWQQDIMRELRYLNVNLNKLVVYGYRNGKVNGIDLAKEIECCRRVIKELQKYVREGEF